MAQIIEKRQPSRGKGDRDRGRLGREMADLKEAYLDSPASDEHGEHSAKTTMGAARGGRQTGKKGDDTSCSHLDIRIHVRQESGGGA